MKRTIFRIIKKPGSTTEEQSRVAVVDFHDEFGMLKMDIPVLPRGTVIDIKPSSFIREDGTYDNRNNVIKDCDWDVVGYEPCDSTTVNKEDKLNKIKDVAEFYKKTKEVIPLDDFYKICSIYAGNLCFYFKENPYFMFSPSFFDDSTITSFHIHPEDIAKISFLRTFEERRQEIASFIHYELLYNESSGNTGITYEKLLAGVRERLSLIGHILTSKEEKGFSAFINYSNYFLNPYDESCRFYMDTRNFTKKTLVFRQSTYSLEYGIYKKVEEWLAFPCSVKSNEYNADETNGLSVEQNEAVSGVFITSKEHRNKVKKGNMCIITGGPGTGKTTVIKEIIRRAIEKDKEIKIKVIAPTGSASKRAKESINLYSYANNVDISTIHRLVGYGKKDDTGVTEKIQESSLIIIDESSMLPLSVFKMLLDKADPSKTKIVLMGDKDQLPSVDAGNILVDLINLGVPTYYLQQNFRSDGSIVEFATKINDGVVDLDIVNIVESIENIPNENGVYFMDISKRKSESVVKDLSDFSCHLGIDEKDGGGSWVLLSARRQGSLASESLNIEIADKLRAYRREHKCSEEDSEINLGDPVYSYAVGDRVIACKTSYDISDNNTYYNGDVGILQSGCINDNEIEYAVVLDGEKEKTTYIHSSDLSLAYALTVHKSQGREYDTVCIIVPNPRNSDRFISKKLLYTGITRAKSRVIIWSTPKALSYAVSNVQDEKRVTLLSILPRYEEVFDKYMEAK